MTITSQRRRGDTRRFTDPRFGHGDGARLMAWTMVRSMNAPRSGRCDAKALLGMPASNASADYRPITEVIAGRWSRVGFEPPADQPPTKGGRLVGSRRGRARSDFYPRTYPQHSVNNPSRQLCVVILRGADSRRFQR